MSNNKKGLNKNSHVASENNQNKNNNSNNNNTNKGSFEQSSKK